MEWLKSVLVAVREWLSMAQQYQEVVESKAGEFIDVAEDMVEDLGDSVSGVVSSIDEAVEDLLDGPDKKE